MNTKIQSSFNKFEKNRKDLMNSLQKYDDALLTKKPSDEAWSVAQVLDHIIEGEESSVAYIDKKIKEGSVGKVAGADELWKMCILKGAFILPIKFKVPKSLAAQPKTAPLADTETRWNALRYKMEKILQQMPDADLKKALWKHPRAGKLSLYQMVDFLNMHLERHAKQVARTLAAVK